MAEQDYLETVKSMRNRTTRLEHEGDYWSDGEKETLKKRFYEGIGITQIAIEMQRTEPAIQQQIERMDLYRRKENPVRFRCGAKPPKCLCEECRQSQRLCPLRTASLKIKEGL